MGPYPATPPGAPPPGVDLGHFLGRSLAACYDRGMPVVRTNKVHIPMGACPPNPPFVTTSPVMILAIDTGPLPDFQGSMPCFRCGRRGRYPGRLCGCRARCR